MTKHPNNKKHEKFMFNVNVFDHDPYPAQDVPEVTQNVEDPVPLPPVFSKEDLEAAQNRSFEEGKKQGLQDAKASRSQAIMATLDSIAEALPALLEHEKNRTLQVEQDVGVIVKAVFEKLLPDFIEKLGKEPLQNFISEALQAQENAQEILVKLHPDCMEGLEKFLDKLKEQNPKISFSLTPDDTLSKTGCHLAWQGGGAVYNPEHIAEEIRAILERGLAPIPPTRHDESEPVMENTDER